MASNGRTCSHCGSENVRPKCQLCDVCRDKPNPRCTKCKQVKPISRFSHDASRPSGYFPWCKNCQLENNRKSFQDPEAPLNGKICPVDDVPIRGKAHRQYCSSSCQGRAKSLRSTYGLTVEQYRAMIPADGLCPICRKRPTVWNVDHDHKTGLTMGVCDTACNVGALAATYHDVEFIRRLLEFVENSPAKRLGIVAVAPPSNKKSNLHDRWNHNRFARCR